jgi:hypothetical protein
MAARACQAGRFRAALLMMKFSLLQLFPGSVLDNAARAAAPGVMTDEAAAHSCSISCPWLAAPSKK